MTSSDNSMMSRVVPGVDATIETSFFEIALIRVDLPTFGGPAITTLSPSRRRSPIWEAAKIDRMRRNACLARSRASVSDSEFTSSISEKSICASIADKALSSKARTLSASRLRAPPAMRRAWRLCTAVSAATRSANPSTSERSSLPFSNARQANSPGSASLSPGTLPRAEIIPARTARPPERCSSAICSPVKLRGAQNRKTRARSSASRVCGSRKVRKVATRSGNISPTPMACKAAATAGPEMRTMAIAARPAPEASANMVSRRRYSSR